MSCGISTFFSYLPTYLFQRFTKTERGREIFHPMVHSPNVCKATAGPSCSQQLHPGLANTCTIFCCFSRPSARSCTGIGAVGRELMPTRDGHHSHLYWVHNTNIYFISKTTKPPIVNIFLNTLQPPHAHETQLIVEELSYPDIRVTYIIMTHIMMIMLPSPSTPCTLRFPYSRGWGHGIAC